MKGADYAASMIRSGVEAKTAMAKASKQTGDNYFAIAAELGRRNANNKRLAIAAREKAAAILLSADADKYAKLANDKFTFRDDEDLTEYREFTAVACGKKRGTLL